MNEARDTREDQVWDYVIAGTGMGGGPLGLRLAQAGFSVLFLEKGRSPSSQYSIKGRFAELAMEEGKDEIEILRNAGRFSEILYDATKNRIRKLRPFLGQGVGGSSALYGMVLERFQPNEFKSWPLSYQCFSKFYDDAERLFRVRKGNTYRHPGTRLLEQTFRNAKLHPYPLPLANESHLSCGNCQSVLCESGCKNHSGNICVDPAVQMHGASLWTDCDVKKIETSGARATGVSVFHEGTLKVIRAHNVILSAGALASPVLLLKSKSDFFPNGLGNQSGLVGRYLMRHLVDLYALKIDSDPDNQQTKEIGLNDFYEVNGEKLGTLQSFGRLPPTEVILTQMEMSLPFRLLKPLLRLAKPFLRFVINQKTKGRLVMASIVEDSPRFENRVWTDGEKTFISYEIPSNDRRKVAMLRNRLAALFRPLGLWFLAASENNEMLAHVCGTCRMGEDAATSVLGIDNRVHGFKNLFVVDASFFPTSGGTNPALTIAANSLRVAELLIQEANTTERATERRPFDSATPDRQGK